MNFCSFLWMSKVIREITSWKTCRKLCLWVDSVTSVSAALQNVVKIYHQIYCSNFQRFSVHPYFLLLLKWKLRPKTASAPSIIDEAHPGRTGDSSVYVSLDISSCLEVIVQTMNRSFCKSAALTIAIVGIQTIFFLKITYKTKNNANRNRTIRKWTSWHFNLYFVLLVTDSTESGWSPDLDISFPIEILSIHNMSSTSFSARTYFRLFLFLC